MVNAERLQGLGRGTTNSLVTQGSDRADGGALARGTTYIQRCRAGGEHRCFTGMPLALALVNQYTLVGGWLPELSQSCGTVRSTGHSGQRPRPVHGGSTHSSASHHCGAAGYLTGSLASVSCIMTITCGRSDGSCSETGPTGLLLQGWVKDRSDPVAFTRPLHGARSPLSS